MIFRRQLNTPAAYHTFVKRALIGRLPFIALMGVLCFHFAQPVLARAEDGQRQIDIGRYVLTAMGDGRWLVTDRQTGDTRVVREQQTGTVGREDRDRSRVGDRSRLGRVWREEESGWTGLWKRRGDSNVFDAVWTGPGRVTGTLDIQFDGPDRVIIDRVYSSDGSKCRYTGRISGGGGLRVSGSYRCGNGSLLSWSATIDD